MPLEKIFSVLSDKVIEIKFFLRGMEIFEFLAASSFLRDFLGHFN
jgi:phenylalanine-4-hydroxylase